MPEIDAGDKVSSARYVTRQRAGRVEAADCDTDNLATSIHGLGDLALETGDGAAAGSLYRQAISLSAGLTAGRPNIRICLAGLAAVAGACGDTETAGVLWGAAESPRETPRNAAVAGRATALPQDAGASPARTTGGGRRGVAPVREPETHEDERGDEAGEDGCQPFDNGRVGSIGHKDANRRAALGRRLHRRRVRTLLRHSSPASTSSLCIVVAPLCSHLDQIQLTELPASVSDARSA